MARREAAKVGEDRVFADRPEARRQASPGKHDLQEAIALLRSKQAELGQPLQYTNFRD